MWENENHNELKLSPPKTGSPFETVKMSHLFLVCMSGMCGTEEKSRIVTQLDWHEMRISMLVLDCVTNHRLHNKKQEMPLMAKVWCEAITLLMCRLDVLDDN